MREIAEKRHQEEEERKRICSIEEQIRELESERYEVEERRHGLERESLNLREKIHCLRNEINRLNGREEYFDGNDPGYLTSSVHAEQQTNEYMVSIDECEKEIKKLKERFAHHICDTSMIRENDELCKFYTGLSWDVFQYVYHHMLLPLH